MPRIGAENMENENLTKKEMLLAENSEEEIKKIEEKSIVEPIPIYRLADLEDVTITNPQNGHILSYNSTSKKWENGAP